MLDTSWPELQSLFCFGYLQMVRGRKWAWEVVLPASASMTSFPAANTKSAFTHRCKRWRDPLSPSLTWPVCCRCFFLYIVYIGIDCIFFWISFFRRMTYTQPFFFQFFLPPFCLLSQFSLLFHFPPLFLSISPYISFSICPSAPLPKSPSATQLSHLCTFLF